MKKIDFTSDEKYNSWCHKRPLICSNHKLIHKANSYFVKNHLSSSESAAYYFHTLTGCKGLEFITFSNVRLTGPIKLSNDVILAPCYIVEPRGKDIRDPIFQATLKMQKTNRFIYDCWIPINDWDEENVRNSIHKIDESLSLFCLESRTFFDWKPKYQNPKDKRSSYEYNKSHIDYLEKLSKNIDTLEDDDRSAIYRSIAWLSQGIRLNEPAARFLFSILAIESLATYIEKSTRDDSPLSKFRTINYSDSQREKCIEEYLNSFVEDNPVKAIEEAYFNCVTSITKRLKRHLELTLGKESKSYNLLFNLKVDGKTLYDLRHYIAHGRANALSEIQRDQINNRVWDAEKVSRKYINSILEQIFEIPKGDTKMSGFLFLGVDEAVIPKPDMYKGPTHIAIMYS